MESWTDLGNDNTPPGDFSYLSSYIHNKYKRCIAKLRTSSHDLGIEKGRHQKPKVPLADRICMYCQAGHIDDETHFVTQCSFHNNERNILYNTVQIYIKDISTLNSTEVFRKILCCQEKSVILAFGKYLHCSFNKRQYTAKQSIG